MPPPKIRELEKLLRSAGFKYSTGKGSHRKYFHHEGVIVVMSGKPANDARAYQIKMVHDAITKVLNES